MFEGKIDMSQVSPNNEWKYLMRVLAIAGLVIFVVYKLWFSWWLPSNTTVVKAESEGSATVGYTEKDISYIEVEDNIIIDRDTKDVLSCSGDIPNSCVRTDLNCSNIATFDLWLRPKENLNRCQSLTAMKEEYQSKHRNRVEIPTCSNGQTLWFVPSTKQYFCK